MSLCQLFLESYVFFNVDRTWTSTGGGLVSCGRMCKEGRGSKTLIFVGVING